MTTVEALMDRSPLRLLQHKNEFIPFCEWLRSQEVKSVLEIGTGPGGTAWVFSQLFDRVITVDIEARHKQFRQRPNVECIQGDSCSDGTVDMVAQALLEEKVDLVLIDAEHTFEAAQENFHRYKKFSKGFVAFHDINASPEWPGMGVPRFWQVLTNGCERYEWIAPGAYSGHVWGGIGAVRA